MNLIKLGVISIVMIFLLFTGISLFIPSHVRVSRAINIAAAPDSILASVKDINRWKQWYPGFDEMRKAGTSVSFTEEKTNEITVEFRSPNKKTIISSWQIIPYPQSDSITLQWYLHFNLRWYPWEKFGSLLYEKSYGKQMETGLRELKRINQSIQQ